jgi:hypothetical protein
MSDFESSESTQQRHTEFVMLLTASHEKLLGYLMSLLGRWHDAQDVLQRASLLMWQKFAAFETGSDFVACSFSRHLRLFSASSRHVAKSVSIFSMPIRGDFLEATYEYYVPK